MINDKEEVQKRIDAANDEAPIVDIDHDDLGSSPASGNNSKSSVTEI